MISASVLAIDLGTSGVAAARRDGNRAPELVELDGAFQLPAVVAWEDEAPYCGSDALWKLHTHGGGLAAPRTLFTDMPDGTWSMGNSATPVPLTGLLAALLEETVRCALADGWLPNHVVLSHPAGWYENGPQHRGLLRAAAAAGIPAPGTISESEAVARFVGREVVQGEVIAVFDLGGGSCDIDLLERTATGYRHLAPPVCEPVGGDSIDAELLGTVLARIPHESASALRAVWHDLDDTEAAASADHPGPGGQRTWERCLYGVQQSVRAAKHQLSTEDSAPVRVPTPVSEVVELNRHDLEEAAAPLLAAPIEALQHATAQAGLDDTASLRCYVSGGATAMPLVTDLLRQTGMRLHAVHPLKGCVALGAACDSDQTASVAPSHPPGTGTGAGPGGPAPGKPEKTGEPDKTDEVAKQRELAGTEQAMRRATRGLTAELIRQAGAAGSDPVMRRVTRGLTPQHVRTPLAVTDVASLSHLLDQVRTRLAQGHTDRADALARTLLAGLATTDHITTAEQINRIPRPVLAELDSLYRAHTRAAMRHRDFASAAWPRGLSDLGAGFTVRTLLEQHLRQEGLW
ncbi:Hsp70 family protein [Streptomyces sp. PSKA30]|uniref:Hsp70 family protein n=1 Tax=Streptomyces sp. PSKA30 TaxID=2874597 RepID=UPI001CD10219|nr:Hsp70 family protein [Streptomyces sp. PSKA30]MBZ9644879.1 Hsp70 family protein [Streptomyces sp. PSKA30]